MWSYYLGNEKLGLAIKNVKHTTNKLFMHAQSAQMIER